MRFLTIDRDLARDSYYAATAPRLQAFPALESSVECDVAVVGAGLAGLSAALDLAQRGRKVVLLEARQVGWGASGRNGGQAIHGLACDQTVIEAQLGLDDARRVWQMSLEALDLLRQRMAEHQIDCDWRPGYLGVATSSRKGAELMDWADRMEKVYGSRFQRIGAGELPAWINSPRYCQAIHDRQSGHLHPLKYALGMARAAARAGVQIFENTAVTGLEPGSPCTVRTAKGSVKAAQVLLAGNVYLQGISPMLEARIMPVGTYIVGSEAMNPELASSLIPDGSAVCDTNFVLDYFRRTPDHRMLYGGRVSYSTMTPRNLAESMRQRMVQTFPELSGVGIEHAWGGFVDITMNRAPDFGRLPGFQDQVYYLQGFSGHGLALTGLAGRLVAEAMTGDASRFDVFAKLQHRNFPGGRWLRTPGLVLGMLWYRLRDILG
jgi:gamma-glutamylputrescine oxidase